MNCAALQSGGETLDAVAFAAKDHVPNGGVVGQHADDDLAVEQPAEVHRGLKTQRSELLHLIRVADIGDDPAPGGDQVRRHRCPHVTEADKADFTFDRQSP